MFAQNIAERLGDFGKAARMRPGGRAGDRAVRERDGLGAVEPDHAIAGAAQGRVNPKDHAVGIGRRVQRRFRFRRDGARRFAADALLHLFKLLSRDAHKRILPVAEKLRKEKRRAEIFQRGVGRAK